MSPSLFAAFCAASPRLSPRAMPLVSGLIYAAVFVLWLMLLSCAFFTSGIFAWSAGLFYIAYDTALLALIHPADVAQSRSIADVGECFGGIWQIAPR
jgi:hypothetical protein